MLLFVIIVIYIINTILQS